jgi:hypothetical protein
MYGLNRVRVVLGMCAVASMVGCGSPPPAPVTSTPTHTIVATPAPTGALAVAVPVGSPTPTAGVTSDYASVMRPPLNSIAGALTRLEAQLAAAQKTPMLMAQDDWRNQTQSVLQDLLASSSALRTATSRSTPPTALRQDALKLCDDVDFVANEFRMALDYDPDATHMIRAARAEKSTSTEVKSVLKELDN